MRTADFNLTEETRNVLGAIRTVARPLLVGGCVRDVLSFSAPKDVDIEVHNLDDISQLVDVLRPFGKVDEVGKAFGVIKLGDLDISLPRRDSKAGSGHRGFEVVVDLGMTTTEAAARRDFTINSMMFDPFTETLIDPFHGQADIQAGLLRHTSMAFAEDPLRVMRGVQFAARFGMSIVPETADLCRSLSGSFHELARERVWEEWNKILTKGRSMTCALEALRVTGWMKHFPELRNMSGVDTDRVMRSIMFSSNYRYAFQLHAPLVLASITLESHHATIESIGAPRSIAEPAALMVKETRRLGTIRTDAEIRRLARRLGDLNIRDLDFLRPCTRVFDRAREIGVDLKAYAPLLNGQDLIDRGLQPGPQFGPLLQRALEFQDDAVFTDRESALAWLDEDMARW